MNDTPPSGTVFERRNADDVLIVAVDRTANSKRYLFCADGVSAVAELDTLTALRDALTGEIERVHAAERVARLDGRTRDPRPGHPTVTIESHAECSRVAGAKDDEQHDVDAAWWDALTEDEREEECRGIAEGHLDNFATSGASAVSRSDGGDV